MARPFPAEISVRSMHSNVLHGQQPHWSCKWGGQGVILAGLALQVAYVCENTTTENGLCLLFQIKHEYMKDCIHLIK